MPPALHTASGMVRRSPTFVKSRPPDDSVPMPALADVADSALNYHILPELGQGAAVAPTAAARPRSPCEEMPHFPVRPTRPLTSIKLIF